MTEGMIAAGAKALKTQLFLKDAVSPRGDPDYEARMAAERCYATMRKLDPRGSV